MKLKQKVKNLEEWVENISTIQSQLLKELGYEIKWKMPRESDIYISKISKKKADGKK